jgi:hypothetical protein
MFNNSDLFEAARKLRPQLTTVFKNDPATAAKFDQALNTLLNSPVQSADIADSIQELFESHSATEAWFAEFLSSGERGIPAILGDMSPVPASQTFICPTPDCPETWTQPSSGYRIPNCPTHNIPLIPVP